VGVCQRRGRLNIDSLAGGELCGQLCQTGCPRSILAVSTLSTTTITAVHTHSLTLHSLFALHSTFPTPPPT
jgi:hypothetical protein